MEKTIVRDVRDIDRGDRRAIEHALGETLRDDQRLVVRLVPLPEPAGTEPSRVAAQDAYAGLPDWCDVFQGLTNDQIAEVERTTGRRLDLTREPS